MKRLTIHGYTRIHGTHDVLDFTLQWNNFISLRLIVFGYGFSVGYMLREAK